jgi:hypothetical protein
VSVLSTNAPAGTYSLYVNQGGYWVVADQCVTDASGYLFATTNSLLAPGDSTFAYSGATGSLWMGWRNTPVTYWSQFGVPTVYGTGIYSLNSSDLVVSPIVSLTLPTGTPDINGWYPPETLPTGFSPTGWTAVTPGITLTDWNVVFTPPASSADPTVRLLMNLSQSAAGASPMLDVDNTAADPFSAFPVFALPAPTGTASTPSSPPMMQLLTPHR